MTTYLQRSGDPGGALHGPFAGPVVLGSDGHRCHMVVSGVPGVYPVHAILGPHDDGSYTLAPAGTDCPLFVRAAGRERVWPVDSPVAAAVGATIMLGSPDGPSFVIRRDAGGRPRIRDTTGMMEAFDRALRGALTRGPHDDDDPTEPRISIPIDARHRAAARWATATSWMVREARDWADRVRHELGVRASTAVGCAAVALVGLLLGGVGFGGLLVMLLDALAAGR